MVNHVWKEKSTQEFTRKTLAEKLEEQINVVMLRKHGMKTVKEAKDYLKLHDL